MNIKPKFTILDGLPTSGPMHLQFTTTGMGTHSEGLAVKFLPERSDPWVGNFQPGFTKFRTVAPHPNEKDVVVVADGQVYVVSPEGKQLVDTMGCTVIEVFTLDNADLVLCYNEHIERIGPNGKIWTSKTLSFDGLQNMTIEGGKIKGEAWTPDFDPDEWTKFEVDLATGELLTDDIYYDS